MRSWVQSLVLGQLVVVNHKSLANKHVVSQSEPPFLSHPVSCRGSHMCVFRIGFFCSRVITLIGILCVSVQLLNSCGGLPKKAVAFPKHGTNEVFPVLTVKSTVSPSQKLNFMS